MPPIPSPLVIIRYRTHDRRVRTRPIPFLKALDRMTELMKLPNVKIAWIETLHLPTPKED